MWWQWLLILCAVILFGAYSLALIWLTAKVARGEQLVLKKAPPPSPTYDPPEVANAKMRRLTEDSIKRNARMVQ